MTNNHDGRMSDARLAEIEAEGWLHTGHTEELLRALKAERKHACGLSDELDEMYDDWQCDKKRLSDRIRELKTQLEGIRAAIAAIAAMAGNYGTQNPIKMPLRGGGA